MTTQSVSFVDAISANRIAFALFIYGILAIPYPFSLAVYHLFLMGNGSTTREYLNSHNFARKDRHRPYDQGSWIKNVCTVLLRERPPTYLRFKEHYALGDPRFGSRRGKGDRALAVKQRAGDVEMGQINAAGGKEEFQGHAVTDLSK